MHHMLGGQRLVAFVGVADLDDARRFYGDTLGLPVTEESPFACVFDAGGTSLRVTKVDTPAVAGYTVLGWAVDDIESLIDSLVGRGVAFERYEGVPQDERGIWRTPDGARVAWFKDPAGNVLSLTQQVT
jgi:catechol 2,3-dioxygenase-like lactoylglutathione lyase family enzyme